MLSKEMLILTLNSVLNNTQHAKHVKNVYDVMCEDIKKSNNNELTEIMDFIKRNCNYIICNNITNKDMLFGLTKTNNADLMAELESKIKEPIDPALLSQIEKYFANVIINKPLIEHREKILNAYINYETGSFEEATRSLDEISNVIRSTNNVIEDNKESSSDGKVLFVEYDTSIGISDTINELRFENEMIMKTGTPIDPLINYFRPKQIYCFSGMSGSFKSGTLLNIVLGLKDNNPEITTSTFDGKKPLVIYFTFEVSRAKTFNRILSYYGYEKDQIESMDDSELERIAEQNLKPKTPDGIRVAIREHRSNSLSDYQIKDIAQDYEKMGYKVIAIVDDYLRLHKVDFTKQDEKDGILPLTKSARLCRNTAMTIGCAYITASQLNRGAEAEFKMALKKTLDATKILNASHLAGSFALKDELDNLIFIYRGNYDNKPYMSMLVDKDRDGNVNYELFKDKYLVCEFEKGNFRFKNEFHSSVVDLYPSLESATGVFAAASMELENDFNAFNLDKELEDEVESNSFNPAESLYQDKAKEQAEKNAKKKKK